MFHTERRGWQQFPAGGQLDDVRESEAQLFAGWIIPVLLQRAAEYPLLRRRTTYLCRLHHLAVSHAISMPCLLITHLLT